LQYQNYKHVYIFLQSHFFLSDSLSELLTCLKLCMNPEKAGTPTDKAFYPSRPWPWLIRSLQILSPIVARWHYQVTLEIDPKALASLRELRRERVLLLPNHPTFQDPIVLYLLSARLGQQFYYLAAQDQLRGRLGGLIQRLGGYSVRRGLADRASIAYTLDLLQKPSCKLVIFAEGGCSFQNDAVIPFRPGAIQIALQAMSRLVRQGQDVPNLYVVPIGIKYVYTQDMSAIIQDTLQNLETTLNISSTKTDDFYLRLRQISQQVLLRCEQDYGLSGQAIEQDSWDDRINRLKSKVIEHYETLLSISAPPDTPDRERVYKIQSILDNLATSTPSVHTNSDPNLDHQAAIKAMARVLNFDAIRDGYVAELPTPERFLDTLTRLEREVFDIDIPKPKAHRIAKLGIENPINLKSFFQDYQQDKVAVVNKLTHMAQAAVQQQITTLSQTYTRPLKISSLSAQ